MAEFYAAPAWDVSKIMHWTGVRARRNVRANKTSGARAVSPLRNAHEDLCHFVP
jgi:hypothetical protein